MIRRDTRDAATFQIDRIGVRRGVQPPFGGRVPRHRRSGEQAMAGQSPEPRSEGRIGHIQSALGQDRGRNDHRSCAQRRVQAAGKTVGELEDAIHDLYVPKFVTHLNVTVKASSDRAFYISGEVKAPGRLLYTGDITVSKAITSAGDFTDFADRTDVILIRTNGDRFALNMNRILAGKDPDPPIFPGDQIKVGRRIF